jgi:hypothetical protein
MVAGEVKCSKNVALAMCAPFETRFEKKAGGSSRLGSIEPHVMLKTDAQTRTLGVAVGALLVLFRIDLGDKDTEHE